MNLFRLIFFVFELFRLEFYCSNLQKIRLCLNFNIKYFKIQTCHWFASVWIKTTMLWVVLSHHIKLQLPETTAQTWPIGYGNVSILSGQRAITSVSNSPWSKYLDLCTKCGTYFPLIVFARWSLISCAIYIVLASG